MAKTEPEEDPNEAKKMPLLDHLIELRQRLFYGAIFVLIAFFGCWFVSNDILLFPDAARWTQRGSRSSHDALPKFIYTSLTEPFFVRVKLSFFGALVLAFPFVAGQIWAVRRPRSLQAREGGVSAVPGGDADPVRDGRRAALLRPRALRVAVLHQLPIPGDPDHPALELLPKVGEYVSLMMQLIFAFGLCFQMPVLLTLLTRVGIIGSDTLKQ